MNSSFIIVNEMPFFLKNNHWNGALRTRTKSVHAAPRGLPGQAFAASFPAASAKFCHSLNNP
jgi:hypothetical protein